MAVPMGERDDAVTVSVDDVTIVLGLFALLLEGRSEDDQVVGITDRVSERLRRAMAQAIAPA